MKEESEPRSPYQGLIPYEEGDAHFFFGREQETQVIIANLFASSLTLLYGASGVGKSSILRAGVTHSLSHRNDLLVVVFSTWQSSPLDDLKAAVAKAASAKRVAGSTAHSAVPDPAARALLEQAETLLEYVSAWSSILDCSLLIILDQFEEYFLYHPQGDAFEIEFAQAVSLSNAPVSFLISIREDSLAKLDRFEKGIPAIFDNYLRLEHLDREAAQAAITKPLGCYNELHQAHGAQKIEIEPELVDEVLNQVKTGQVLLGEAGRGGRNLSGEEARIETPFLQMVMTRLWNKEMESGSNLLRLETLKQLGNAEHIIRTHLDDAMSALTPDEQEIAANIFHYLVTPTGSKIAHSTRTLFHYTGLPQAQIQPVLNKLSAGAARVLQPVAPPADPQAPPNYEIYHDVLAAAILDWRRRFMQVQGWSHHTEEMGLEQRRVMQWRIGLIALLLLIGTLIASLVVTWRARTQETRALSREVAAVALNNISKDSELSFLLAREAVKIDPTDEAVKSLRETLEEYPLLAVMKTNYVVVNASFSPDGRFVLTGGGEQMARVWDPTTGKLVKKFIGPRGLMSKIIFSPDGMLIATVTETNDRTVQIWETNSDSDKPLAELKGPEAAKINKVAFSPDSRLVATACQDQQVRIWDARTERSMMALQHNSPVWGVAFSPDGTHIATACVDGNSYIWETSTGNKIMTLTGHGTPIRDISSSPDGNLIATAGDDSQAHVWDVKTGQIRFDLNLSNYGYRAAFSPDGQAILTLDAANRVDLWDANTGQRKIGTIYNDPSRVSYPAFSPDGQFIACSNGGNDAWVWDAATGKLYKTFAGHTSQVYLAVFSPNGYHLVTTSKDGTARIWRVRKSLESLNLGNAKNASFSPDGRFIIGANQVWDFVTGERVGDPLGNSYSVRLAAFSPDGEHILIVDDYSQPAQIWDARSRSFVKELPSNALIVSVTFSGNGKLVETRGVDHSVRVWDINTGQSVAELKDPSISNSSAISPDGQYVVTGSETANARIWDVGKQQLLKELVGHTAAITSVAYSHDGKLIVTGSDDQRVMVWNAQTGERKASLQGDSGTKSVAFSPDGRLIMAVTDVGTARIWPWPSPETIPPAILENVSSATFSPDGMFVLAIRAGAVANIYPRESFVPLPDLIEMATSRAQRSLTCDERRKYLHQLCLW